MWGFSLPSPTSTTPGVTHHNLTLPQHTGGVAQVKLLFQLNLP